MALDIQNLATVLLNTFNPDGGVRALAEQQLAQFERVPGGHGKLLELMALPHDAIPFEVKQAASLRLKNLYAGYSTIREGDLQKISELDRQHVRERLLEAIIRQTDPRLRVQLLEVAYYMWPSEKPSEWASLVPEIVHNLQHGMQSSPPDLLRIYGCVCTLRMVLKRYQFRDPKARAPVYEIVNATFPLLLPILQAMAGLGVQATEETREICRILIKIFFLSTTLSLPPVLIADFNKCVPWFDVMIHLLEAPVPGLESIQGGNPMLNAEKLRVTPGWRCKKWIVQIFLRLYNRWGRPKMVGEGKKDSKEEKHHKKEWAKQFEMQYTTKLLGMLMNILKVKTQGGFVIDRIIHQSLTFISTSIDSSIHYKMLKPYLPFLIQEVILQQLTLNESDLILWKTDPHEFIRRSLDLMAEFQDPRMAAAGFLNDLLSFRTRDTLELTLKTIQHVFETYESTPPEQRNYILKEGAMRMFGSIKRLMMSEKNFRGGIEDMLKRHVIPEFTSPHGFLRSRACWTLRKYSKLTWVDSVAHGVAVKSCVERLSDPELPVKMESWSATSYIIEHETVFEFLQPMLPSIISAFHTLFDEIGNEAVVGVLETLVERFGEQMIPYAIQLVGKLTDLYLQLQHNILQDASGVDDYDDDTDEAASTAYHCLKTITSVLYAIQSRPELYEQLLPPCTAIFDVSINERSVETYDTVLDMISVFLFQPESSPIPDCMWKYLPQVTGSFNTWAHDFLNCMLPVFDTYLSKGAKLLITPQGQPMLEAIFNVAKTILQDQERLIDAAHACILVESILANLRGQVDVLIPPIVQMSGTRLLTIIHMEEAREAARKRRQAEKKMKKKQVIKKGKGGKAKFPSKEVEEQEDDMESQELAALKMGLLDNIGIACHYNPILFCQVIQSQPQEWSGKLFNIWLSYVKSMKNDFDVAKNAVLGLASLLLIPISALPDVWRNALPAVLGILLAILTEMSALLAEDKKTEEPVAEEAHGLFHDIHEDVDVYQPEDQRSDSENVDDAAEDGDEDAPIDFLDDMEEAMLGTDGIDKFVSPLDDIDPFIFFAQAVQTLSQQENAFFQQWIQSIGPEGQTILQNHINQGRWHGEELEKEKAEEAQKAATQAAGQSQ